MSSKSLMWSQIKAAILVTLGVLIAKAGLGLKPFVPQLQTTFLKCLADPAGAQEMLFYLCLEYDDACLRVQVGVYFLCQCQGLCLSNPRPGW